MPILRSTRIRWRLFRLLISTAGLLVLVAGAFWYLTVEPALRLELARSQRETARFAADRISAFIERKIAMLEAAADIGRLWDNDPTARKQALYRLFKLEPHIHDVSLSDAQGREIFRLSRSRTYTDADLRSVANEAGFLTAIGGETSISRVFHRRTDEPFISISIPVRFTASEIRGALSADVNLKTLWTEVSDIKVGKSGFVYIVSREGQLIAHPDYSRVLLREDVSHVEKVREFLSPEQRDFGLGHIEKGLNGNKVLTTFRVVPQSRWGVVVEEPIETALAEIDRLKSLSALLLGIAISAIFGVSFYFSRKISDPVARLERGAEQLTRGNLDHQIDIRTGDEIESLAAKFNQMAAALKDSHEGLEAKVAERTREISALYAALAPLKPAESLTVILNDLAERLVEATGADAGLIRLRDIGKESFRCVGIKGFDGSYLGETTTLPEESAVEQVFLRNQPIISRDVSGDNRLKGKKQLAAGFCSCALLPFNVAGETRGVIHLASRTRGFFSPDQETRLMTIARQLGVAVENHELYDAVAQSREETQRNLERIRALHHIDVAITSKLGLNDVLRVLLEQIDVFLSFSAVPSITLLDRETGRLEPAVCRNADESEWQSAARKSGSQLANFVFKTGCYLAVDNIRADGRIHRPEFFEKHGLHSYLGVPLKGTQGVLGVLGLYTKEPRRFRETEIEFMTTLGSQAAIAIQNSQLFEETRLREMQARESNRFLTALQSVANAVSQSLDLDRVLNAAIENVTEIFGFEATQIHIYQEGTDELRLKAAFENDPARFTRARTFKPGGRYSRQGRGIGRTADFRRRPDRPTVPGNEPKQNFRTVPIPVLCRFSD